MELTLEFLDFLVYIALWLLFFSIARTIIFGRLEKAIDRETEQLKEKLSKMIHRIKQEKHGDMYYWFDSDDDQFLAQGRTDTEIIDVLKSRFPTHVFVINNEKALRGPEWKLTPISELTKKSV